MTPEQRRATSEQLARLLPQPLRVHVASDQVVALGYTNRPPSNPSDNTPRLVMVLEGCLGYMVEGRRFELAAGQSLFMSAPLSRR